MKIKIYNFEKLLACIIRMCDVAIRVMYDFVT